MSGVGTPEVGGGGVGAKKLEVPAYKRNKEKEEVKKRCEGLTVIVHRAKCLELKETPCRRCDKDLLTREGELQ